MFSKSRWHLLVFFQSKQLDTHMENMFRLSNGQATAKRLKTDAESYKASANDCITLHLFDPVKTTTSWPPKCVSSSFQPEFTHQIFGDDEEIDGYRGLAVDIYFSQVDFQACVEVKFEDKAHGATDILRTLQKHFPGGITADKEQYLAAVTTVSPADLGHTLQGVKAGVTIREANLASSKQGLQALHARLQPFLLFFIDGASFIDAEDTRWEVLLATEQHAGQERVVGFCTLYTFYAYPDKRRFRLSQILVLPPFQRHGIGAALLEGAYAMADKYDATDVTFEDPTDTLQGLRDLVDLRRAMDCGWLQSAATQVADTWSKSDLQPSTSEACGSGNVSAAAATTSKALLEAQQKLRISQLQARRIWEAVLYAQPKVRTDEGLATLAQLVRKRIEGSSASVKKQAEGKRIFDVAHHGFIMRKCKGRAPMLPGNGVPVALENDEQTPEEAEQALTEALTARIASLDAQLAKLGILGQ